MLLKLVFILIVLNNFTVSDNSFYSQLVSNFPIKSRSITETTGIKKLTKIIIRINQFYRLLSQRNKTQHSVQYYQSSSSSFVIKTLYKIFDVVGFRSLLISVREGVATALTCLACHSLAALIFNGVISKFTMALAFHEVCIVLRLSTPRVCVGLIEQMKEHVDYIRNKSKLKLVEVCGVLLGTQCFIGRSDNIFWKLDIPDKREFRKTGRTQLPLAQNKKFRKNVHKILQITDIHLDLDYQIGSPIVCNEPICCRNTESLEERESNITAGHWGAYPCDIPLQTVENAFEEISKNTGNVVMWYWTGDIVAHDIWQYSRKNSLMLSEKMAQLLNKYRNSSRIVPVIGNHEAVPVNSFPPPHVNDFHSISWLYNGLADQWSKWLPKDALQLLRYGGYYTLIIRPGFRVIVVNTNYCSRLNIWTYYDSVDPADQLNWLIKELLLAEEADDNVHIVGHVPVDNRECTQAWVYNYLAIVERFSNTIVGQFFGHTHGDEFRVLYSNDNYTKPIGYELLTPSLTTFEKFNPSYRIISVHKNGIIADIDTFFFNLTQANQLLDSVRAQSPVWYYEYSMRKEYSLNNFTYNEFDRLVKRIASDKNYLQTFYSHYYRFSDCLLNEFCDEECKEKFITDIILTNPYDKSPKSILQRG